jgi:hypothetical protein
MLMLETQRNRRGAVRAARSFVSLVPIKAGTVEVPL